MRRACWRGRVPRTLRWSSGCAVDRLEVRIRNPVAAAVHRRADLAGLDCGRSRGRRGCLSRGRRGGLKSRRPRCRRWWRAGGSLREASPLLGQLWHCDPFGRRCVDGGGGSLVRGAGDRGGAKARENERGCVWRCHLVLRRCSLDGALGHGTGGEGALPGVLVDLAVPDQPGRGERLAYSRTPTA